MTRMPRPHLAVRSPLLLAIVLPLAAVLLVAMTARALGQTLRKVCGSYADQVTFLGTTHGETLVAVGTTLSGVIVEIFASPGGGTWTLLSRPAEGVFCLEGAGTDWTAVTPMPPPLPHGPRGRDG